MPGDRAPPTGKDILSTLEMGEPAASELAPIGVGAFLARGYRSIKLIGAGGMGLVYHAHDEVLGKEVPSSSSRVA